MSITAKLGLLDFDPLSKGQTRFNRVTRTLDGLLHCKVRDIGESDPADLVPLPEAGEVFIVAGTGAGVWLNQDDNLAIAKETVIGNDATTWDSVSDWTFITPIEGFIIWMRDGQNQRRTFDSAGWSTFRNLADLNGADSTGTRDRIIEMLDSMRDHGLISG